MGKLSIDNPFFEFMGKLGDWILLNILFFLTSLPLITIGMSITALYRVVLRRRRGESRYVIKEYFQAFKDEWKKSMELGLIFLLTGSLLVFDILFAGNLPFYLNTAIGILVVIWCFIFSYAFALHARFENTLPNILKNALYLSVKNFPVTLLMVVLNAIPVLGFILGEFWFALLMPVYMTAGFSFTAKINSIFLDKIFFRFMSVENSILENTAG